MATHSSILSWKTPLDRGAWCATAHEVSKGQTRLSHSGHDHFLKDIFGCGPFLKCLLNLSQYCFYFVSVFWPQGMRDLCSPVRA